MRVFIKGGLFVILFTISFHSLGQKVHLDSVRQALFSTRNDTLRATLSMDYALTLVKLDGTSAQVVDYTNAAFYYAKIGISIAKRLKDPRTLALVHTW